MVKKTCPAHQYSSTRHSSVVPVLQPHPAHGLRTPGWPPKRSGVEPPPGACLHTTFIVSSVHRVAVLLQERRSDLSSLSGVRAFCSVP